MAKKHTSRNRSAQQRQLRQRRDEHAFLFDTGLARCVAAIDRDEWELALSICGGDTAEAARHCGVQDAAAGTKALWGRSAEEALATYRRWQHQRARP